MKLDSPFRKIILFFLVNHEKVKAKEVVEVNTLESIAMAKSLSIELVDPIEFAVVSDK
jgi:hypothetical protein